MISDRIYLSTVAGKRRRLRRAGGGLLRLSSPRHVTLHKTREPVTNFRPWTVFPHWRTITERSIDLPKFYADSALSLSLSPPNDVFLLPSRPRAEYSRSTRGRSMRQINVRRVASQRKCHETAASAVGCKLPSAACGHGTPPRVINPHQRPSYPLSTLSATVVRDTPYAFSLPRRECLHQRLLLALPLTRVFFPSPSRFLFSLSSPAARSRASILQLSALHRTI